jgi:hypothetical protein
LLKVHLRTYVADDLQGTVNVFSAGANGSSTPIRSIQWDASTFRAGVNLAVDGTGALYVLDWVTDQIVAAQKRSF